MADSHGGSRLGLLNPETTLVQEDEQGNLVPWTPEPTKTQRYLWNAYEEDINNVIGLAAGDEVILLHVGDITQGDRHPGLLVSTRLADQLIIGEENLAPWFGHPNVSTARLAKGTASHVFGEGSAEVLIARALGQRFADRDVEALYHGLLDVGGVVVDYAHHGPGPGIRDWTSGNQVRYYLKSLIATEWKRGRVPARLVLRGHYHTWVWETVRDSLGGADHTFDMCLLPSYCAMGDHGHRATRSAWVQVHGLVAFEIANGGIVEVHPFKRELDLRTKESL
jgi:hypothetical protein